MGCCYYKTWQTRKIFPLLHSAFSTFEILYAFLLLFLKRGMKFQKYWVGGRNPKGGREKIQKFLGGMRFFHFYFLTLNWHYLFFYLIYRSWRIYTFLSTRDSFLKYFPIKPVVVYQSVSKFAMFSCVCSTCNIFTVSFP